MKNLFYRSFLLLATLFISNSPIQAQTFGYVNSAAILSEMPDVKRADAKLEVLQNQLQRRGQQMVAQLEADYAVIQQKIERGEASPAQQKQEVQILEKRQQQIIDLEKDMGRQLESKRAELLQPIYEKINNAIAAVAQEKGYRIVFDQGVLLYASETLDVSSLVRAKLGMQ
ncbi:OmpH family outer membrane protein [Aequorivita viscosa]|nr:OmpH family outer membrane protein [Aequorivita viscosa]